MNRHSLYQLGDDALERSMLTLFAEDAPRFALQIAHLAEFDARRLYARDGFPSLFAYCVERVRLSGDAAKKRIRAARAAHRHPALFEALADGRLHLTALVLLAPKLTDENVEGLIEAAAHQAVPAVQQMLAERFPSRDIPWSLDAQQIEVVSKPPVTREGEPVAAASHPVGDEVVSKPPARVAPLSPGRFEAHFTIREATCDALRRLEQLLGRRANSEDIDAALKRGLESVAADIEKRRFGATDRPRKARKSRSGRYIPAAVKREVRARDGDQCTFVAESGRRCSARGKLEYDHITPVARGGKSTPDNLRLRCRAHNQFEAEQMLGNGFMQEKRKRAQASRAVTATPHAAPAPPDPALDVTPWLRQLGFRAEEAKQAAARCADMEGASLEARVRAALSMLAPRTRRLAMT